MNQESRNAGKGSNPEAMKTSDKSGKQEGRKGIEPGGQATTRISFSVPVFLLSLFIFVFQP
jgi:hypothetical protein